jgi:heptosyltransferase-2
MTPSRITVHMPNWVGDVVMATPTLRMLNEQFPDAETAIIIRPYAAALLSGYGQNINILAIDDKTTAGMLKGVRRLRAFRPDTALVLSHSIRSALMARLSGAKRRLGYKYGGRELLLTDTPTLPEKNGEPPQYMGMQYAALAKMLGCTSGPARPELPVLDDDEKYAESLLAEHRGHGPLVGLAPGASFGASKLWPPERFADVANNLIEKENARIVMPTGPGEIHIHDRIESAIRNTDAIVDVGIPDLSLLKSIVKRLDMLIASDSGVRHIAVAFDIPTVVLMGPTRPEYTDTPFERGAVIRHNVECGPCHEPKCSADHICMDLITVDEVTKAAQKTLKSP